MAPKPQPPFRQIKPGLYLDANNAGVLNVAEILKHLHIPDNDYNRKMVAKIFTKAILGTENPDNLKMLIRDPGDPTWREMSPEELEKE